ncbi:helix-turn-helix domain-containing protein [Halomonas sp. 86]|uniref:helix-turn-helix domain-containing protein n=1 Tax=unclassified Halomonas TaxID=2609666 RepID=UPI00403326EE
MLIACIIDEGLRPKEVAQVLGVSVRTVYKWLYRFREDTGAPLEAPSRHTP